jgi:hypothetical protein
MTTTKGPRIVSGVPLRSFADGAYLPPGAGPLLLLVPGPTLPWLDGVAEPWPAPGVLDFVFAPVVVDDIEDCLCCFCDLASAVNVEPTSPATARAQIANVVFRMRYLPTSDDAES